MSLLRSIVQRGARFGLIACLTVGLSACTETTTTSSGAFGEDTNVRRTGFFLRGSSAEQPNASGRAILRRGTNQFFNEDAFGAGREGSVDIEITDKRLVEMSLIGASIEAAAQAILSDLLGFQYVIADGVSGRVTIQTTGPIEKAALLDIFEAALAANGARLKRSGQTISIVAGSSGNRAFRLAGRGNFDGATIVVAPVEFISASQMVNLLNPLIDEGLTAIADRNRNLILMTGSRDQLESAVDALNIFDVDALRGKSVALLRLNSAEPEDIVEELKVIFETQENGLLEGVIEFVPNNRLRSVLVITSRSRYLAEAQRWVRELDNSALRTKRVTEVYALQSRDATEMAPILNDLLSQTSVPQSEGGDASRAASGTSRVAADAARNALIVLAFPAEHEELRRMLRELDKAPRQVLLEATIAEVTLNDEVSLGVRWFFETGNFANTFSDAASGAISPNFPGFSTAFSAGSAQAVLNALAGVTNVKVISSPTLTVTDNNEAVLQIGDEVPIATQTSVGTDDPDAPIVTNVEYRDTGVILNVKPRIGAGGRVILDITQEVSDVANTNTSGIDSPTIRQRLISTTVALVDGATLALGGLVQESDNVTETKVPGLAEVPLLGAAFRSRSVSKERSELLILIRPRVIASDDDASRITAYWRSRLSAANEGTLNGLGSPKHTIGDIFQ